MWHYLHSICQKPIRFVAKTTCKRRCQPYFQERENFTTISFQWWTQKTDKRKNVCYWVPCLNCSFCYIGETSQWWDEQESQHKRSIKNNDSNNSFFMHLKEYPDHVIGWEQVTFLACDSRYSQRRMKESILIDIFSHKGVMNIEDGMKKDACWNVLLPSLRKNFSDSRITWSCNCIVKICEITIPIFGHWELSEFRELMTLLKKTSL